MIHGVLMLTINIHPQWGATQPEDLQYTYTLLDHPVIFRCICSSRPHRSPMPCRCFVVLPKACLRLLRPLDLSVSFDNRHPILMVLKLFDWPEQMSDLLPSRTLAARWAVTWALS